MRVKASGHPFPIGVNEEPSHDLAGYDLAGPVELETRRPPAPVKSKNIYIRLHYIRIRVRWAKPGMELARDGDNGSGSDR